MKGLLKLPDPSVAGRGREVTCPLAESTGTIDLTVVIGTRNRRPILEKCLAALSGRIRASHQIIVIDAGSTDGTLEFLRSLSGIRLVCDGALVGQARSLNRVLRTVNSRYICWLSDDNVVQDGMLDQAIGILDDHPKIGMVALKTRDVTGQLSRLPYIGGLIPAWILTCNQGMLRRDVFLRLGGFDETFRDYGIDMDLTARVLLAGWSVVMTRHIAIHHYRNHEDDSWISRTERRDHLAQAGILYQQKHAALLEYLARGPSRAQRRLSRTCYDYKCRDDLGGRLVQRRAWGTWVEYNVVRGLLSFWASIVRTYSRITQRGTAALNDYCIRDWYNAFCGAFISRWDLLRNFGRPYYLVQRISRHSLRRIASLAEQTQEHSSPEDRGAVC